jgi:hypothetical protein
MRAMLSFDLSLGGPSSSAVGASAAPAVGRRSRADGRAQRWDAGPAPTARDLAALRFVGEQYAVRGDVAAVLLTRLSTVGPEAGAQLSRRAVREQLGRWEAAGWAERRRLLGQTWVTPTRAGLRLVGLDYDVWSPVLDRLDHHHAAAVVRLARELVPGQGGWVGERELWRRRGKASWHLADGALPAPLPEGWRVQGIGEAWELVEVELTQKARPRYLAALQTRPPHAALVTYYVPASLHAPLSAQLASVVRELGGRPPVAVELLPEVAGTSYGGAR